jgi:hypothetical protein
MTAAADDRPGSGLANRSTARWVRRAAWRARTPSVRLMTVSVMLVAWSAMRSRLRAVSIRWELESSLSGS